jgi:hypothetical protein
MKEMKTEFRSRKVISPDSCSGGLIVVPRPNNLIAVFLFLLVPSRQMLWKRLK